MKVEVGNSQKKATVVMLIIYSLISVLVSWRIWLPLHLLISHISLYGYVSVYFVLCFLLPIGFYLPHSKFSKAIHVIGSYWVSLQITLFFAAIFEWAASIVLVKLFRMIQGELYVFLAINIYFVTVLLTVCGAIHRKNIRLTEYQFTTTKSGFKGKSETILHLSDLHLGSVNDINVVKKLVGRINSLHADVICITGDTFTENIQEVFELDEIIFELKKLKSTRGVFACLGNHDTGVDFPCMLEFFKNANITLFQDDYIEYEGVVLLGRSDMTPGENMNYKRKPVEECLKTVDKENYIVVMDHQPGDIENTANTGVDLLLSGHTHGGQFYPLNRLIKRVFPHYHGCKKYGDMYSIVSSGTCTAIPYVRLTGNSEIIQINVSGV